jgi:hypothetical protein
LTSFLFLFGAPPAAGIGVFENHSDVGTVLHPGSVQYDPATRTYTIAGSGENMWASTDAFQFVWNKVSGDFTLTADVTFLGSGGEAHRKGVLIMRQSLDADSPYVDAALHGNGLTSIQARDVKGAITHEVQSNVSAPRRARLEKRGKFVYVFVAGEGEELHPSGGSMQIAFDGPFYVGIGVCAHNKDAVAKVAFSNVELTSGSSESSKPALYSTLEVVRLAALTDHRAVVVAPGRIESPRWNADGSALIYKYEGGMQRVPADGGKPEAATAETASPAKSDDYFSSDRSGTAQIWHKKSDGSEERVTSDEYNDFFPHISPDGQHLIFLSYDKEVEGHPEEHEVTMRMLTFSNSKVDVIGKMVGGEGTVDASMWSPDSHRFAFVSYQLIPK